MAVTPIPYPALGVAKFEQMDTWLQSFLFAGSDTPPRTYPYTVAPNTVIAQFQVVGLNGSGQLIPAVRGTTQAIGVASVAITTAVGDSAESIPVYFSGCFNGNALVYDASYSTTAFQQNAFAGAPAPTQITIRWRPTGNPNAGLI